MAKAPLRIADALGFGGSRKPYVSPYLREVSKIKRGEKLPGTITRAPRPSAATQLAQLLTPNTRFGNELAAKIAPAVEMSPLGILTGLVDARRAYQEGNTANAAGLGILAALGAAPVGKAAREVAENAAERGILAYHASPYSFDRFDMSKIGTGEGAQAFGYGLYAAEEEAVAKEYKKKFAEQMYSRIADRLLQQHGGIDTAIDAAKSEIKRLKELPLSAGGASKLEGMIDLQEQAVKQLELIKEGKPLPSPSMYQIRINAQPEEFADWDKPFSEQPQNIQDAIRYAFGPQSPDAKFGGYSMDKPSAMHTRLMKEKGVKGIKYLDQASRDTGEGSRNYVVFDDALINILKKYGIAIPALAGGGLLATQPQQDGGF